MNTIKHFNYDSNAIRSLNIEGQTYFIAEDISRILNYRHPYKHSKTYCMVDELRTSTSDSNGDTYSQLWVGFN